MSVHIVGRMATSRGGKDVQLDRCVDWEGTIPGDGHNDEIGCKVYGVFDGHGISEGGPEIAAQICQDQLLTTLFSQPEWVRPHASWRDIRRALRKTFRVLEEQVIQQTRDHHTTDGCSVALLVIRGDQGWVCNVGESHVVRYADSHVDRLTTEHTLENEHERMRVPQWAQVDGSVMGKMAATRSIGDRDLKRDRTQHPEGRSPVTWFPSVRVITVSDKDEFLVATKGLWRKGSDSTWARMAHHHLNEKDGIRATARCLVNRAKEASGHRKNATVIVVLARRHFNGRYRSADDHINGDIAEGNLHIHAGIETKYHAISAYCAH